MTRASRVAYMPGVELDALPQAADPLLWALGRRIRTLRNEVGISQLELAGAAGMRKQFLNRVENGRQNPNVRTLSRIAIALGLPLATLFEGVQPDAALVASKTARPVSCPGPN